MKGTAIHIDEIYTDVTIEKLENKSTGVENTPIDNYKELFQILDSSSKIKQKKTKGSSREQFNARAKIADSKPKQEGQKLLFQGDPGIGKTTLSKKMANDWAKRAFTTFVIVFFVSMKLVTPGQPIENIIIQQNSKLIGFDVSPKKLRGILEVHGNKCLLIIDGFDEAPSDNAEILKF